MSAPCVDVRTGALVNALYDARLAQYEADGKQWDASVCLAAVLRGGR